MKLKLVTVSLFAAALLVGCNAEEPVSEEAKTTIETNEEKDIKALVHEYSVGNKGEESAYITSKEMVVTDESGKESSYPLPEDEFFVSIAPYVNETHPCENHSLTGCQGEMVNKDVAVLIEDTEGNVVVDETFQTPENGFIDLWLPRDKTYKIKMESEGKMVESEFSTFEKDGTCITTMQLT